MAEIKSTLDLVMERTRGLSLSDREKKEMKDKELADKVRALFERFINEYMGIKWLETEINNLGETGRRIRGAVKLEILDRLAANGRTPEVVEKLLSALESLTGAPPDVYRGIIADHEKYLSHRKLDFSGRINADLAREGISGSAVLPNIAADPVWKAELEKISQEFRQKMMSA